MAAATEHALTELDAFARQVAGCTRCRLAQGRTQVVFGVGDPDADLMFVGEAPGFHEDKQGFPFVGQAGKLLDKLLAGIGLERANVYVANVLKCRPPGNRDPQPDEIQACEGHLFRQIELIQPRVVATLGNFATKLLSGKPTGITRVHGVEQEVTLGGSRVLLYPLYHPAAPVDVSHLDLYRFQGLSAAEWGDLEPYFEDAICFVEWPEAAAGALPPARVEVRLSHVDPAHRMIALESAEPSLLDRLAGGADTRV